MPHPVVLATLAGVVLPSMTGGAKCDDKTWCLLLIVIYSIKSALDSSWRAVLCHVALSLTWCEDIAGEMVLFHRCLFKCLFNCEEKFIFIKYVVSVNCYNYSTKVYARHYNKMSRFIVICLRKKTKSIVCKCFYIFYTYCLRFCCSKIYTQHTDHSIRKHPRSWILLFLIRIFYVLKFSFNHMLMLHVAAEKR